VAKLEQLKRSLLDQAISENVDLIAGRRPASRRERQVGRSLRVVVTLLSVGLALALAALLRERLALPAEARDAPLAASHRAALERVEPVGPVGPEAGDRTQVSLQRSAPQGITAQSLGLDGSEDDAAATPSEPLAPPSDRAPAGPPAERTAVAERLYSAPSRIDPAILPLTVRRVIVDPGHGGHSPGTVAAGLFEKELTLDIALRLEQLLSAGGFDVELTRGDDTHVELVDRVGFANRQRGDLFVSIHVNWLGSADARGIETFYLGPTDDPMLEQLAHVENKSSGYSLTDFRTLLDGIYADARRDVSRQLAASIHRELVRHLRKVSPGLRDRGVKTAPFVVLIGTEMPAVLAEVSCLSSDEEIALLREPSYRQQIAEALHAGIVSYARSIETGPLTARPQATIAAGAQGN
jgi:N-acetylmuramoyl-L-alanine amidase